MSGRSVSSWQSTQHGYKLRNFGSMIRGANPSQFHCKNIGENMRPLPIGMVPWIARRPRMRRCGQQRWLKVGGGTGAYYTVCLTRPLVCAKLLSLSNDIRSFREKMGKPESRAIDRLRRPGGVLPPLAFAQKRFREIAAADPKDTWAVLNAWSRPQGALNQGAFGPNQFEDVGLPTILDAQGLTRPGVLPDRDAFIATYGKKPASPPELAIGAICEDKLLGSDCESGYKCDTSILLAPPKFGSCVKR
jgi:hypothetical protein